MEKDVFFKLLEAPLNSLYEIHDKEETLDFSGYTDSQFSL